MASAAATTAARAATSSSAAAASAGTRHTPARNGVARNAYSLTPPSRTAAREAHRKNSGAVCSNASGRASPPRSRRATLNASIVSSGVSGRPARYSLMRVASPRDGDNQRKAMHGVGA